MGHRRIGRPGRLRKELPDYRSHWRMTTDELGRDITARLRRIAEDGRADRRLSYSVEAIEAIPTGGIEPDNASTSGSPGAVCTIRVAVRDKRSDDIYTVEFEDWSVGGLLETSEQEESQRSAFAWLLHANLDEWWITVLKKR